MCKYFILALLCFSSNILPAQISEEPQNTRYYYNGQIKNVDLIQMNLHIDNYEVTGAFVMEGTGEYYFVKGRLSGDKKGIGIRVYNALRQYIASIEAKITSEEKNFGKRLEGVYKPAGENSPYEILLRKITEFAIKNGLVNTPPNISAP